MTHPCKLPRPGSRGTRLPALAGLAGLALLSALCGWGAPARAEDATGARELAAFDATAFGWLPDARGGAVVDFGWASPRVVRLDLATGERVERPAKLGGDAYGRGVSPDGRYLAWATTAPGIDVLDLVAGQKVASYPIRTRNDVGDVAALLVVGQDGRAIAWQGLAPGAAGELRAWNADGRRGPTLALEVGERVEALTLSPDSGRLVAATRKPDGSAHLLLVDPGSLRLLRRHGLPAPPASAAGQTTGLAISADGRRVLASVPGGATGRTLLVIDAASLGEEHATAFAVALPADFAGVSAVRASPDGSRACCFRPGVVANAESGDASQWLRDAEHRTGTVLVLDLVAAEAILAAEPGTTEFGQAFTRVGRASPLGLSFAPDGRGLCILTAKRVVAVAL